LRPPRGDISSPGEFDGFGGRNVPEPLEEPLEQRAVAFDELTHDPDFRDEFECLLEHFAGRPTPVFYAETLSERYDADIYSNN